MREMIIQFPGWKILAIPCIAILLACSMAHALAVDPPESPNPSETTQLALASTPAATASIQPAKFPRLKDIGYASSAESFLSPVFKRSAAWMYGLIRMSILFAFVLFWLRGLSLCVSREQANKQNSWTARLFAMGIVGSLVGIVLPGYLPLVGLLVATNVAPFILYKRVGSPTPESDKPRWREFLSFPSAPQAADTAIVFEPIVVPTASAGPEIRLIEKSVAPDSRIVVSDSGERGSKAFQLVRSLIGNAVASRATDLHIGTKANHVVIQQRVDGSLLPVMDLPLELGLGVINVYKVMSDLNIADRRRSQDGSFRVDVGDRRLSLRVSSQGTETGEKLSIRVLDPAKTFANFDSLGMSPLLQQRLRAEIGKKHGLILIVGSTGAGKSTTACAALQTIDTNERNVISIEDPIEYQIPDVDQIEVNSRAGQTFEKALRSVLRMDADVIFIGEIRDEETAKIACRAAMTGQLVIATMHSGDAISGALRMMELGADVKNVASSLRAVLAQTLVRTLCVDCRIPYRLTAEQLEELRLQGLEGLDGELFRSPDINTSNCTACAGRGFLRRTGVFELLTVNSAVREQIRSNAHPALMMEAARDNAMLPLVDDGLRLVREGRVSLDEFQRVFDTL